jgi:hypothetical protein
MKPEVLTGVPKKSWGVGNKKFSVEKSYTFKRLPPSSMRPDLVLYSFKDDNGKVWVMPYDVVVKDFITL